MSRMSILGGDIPRGITFYTNPGSIRDIPITAMLSVNPEKLKEAGVRRSFGFSRKIHFIAEFEDGKRALVETDRVTYERLLSDLGDGPVSADEIEARRKENMRTRIVFFGVLILGTVVLSQYLEGYLPFLTAFIAAMVAALVTRTVFPGGR